MDAGHVVVVGASAAGLRTSEQPRVAGWRGAITVVGDESHPPYQRPPLSKDFLHEAAVGGRRDAAADPLILRPRAGTARVDWRLGTRVVSCDLRRGEVGLDDGTRLPFDGLVVATGLRARRLPLVGPERGRHRLRTLNDARSLAEELRPGARVAIAGAGLIGCELAGTLVGLGAEVVLVDTLDVPLAGVLGQHGGQLVQRHHEGRGVRFHLGRRIIRLLGDERISGVELDDGTAVVADLLVEAIGAAPATDWLEGNALDLRDGVLCDEHLRAEGTDAVVAVGDVARFPNLAFDPVPRRIEHWTNVMDTARRAGRTLAAQLTGGELDPAPFTPLPTFWSDQGSLRIQGVGIPALATAFAPLDEPLPEGLSGVVGTHDGRTVVAALLGDGVVPSSLLRQLHALVGRSPTVAAAPVAV